MFLSKVILGISKNAFRDIASPYRMHQFVMSAFPNNITNERVMFFRNKNEILVQSSIKPNWEKSQNKYAYIGSWDVKEFTVNFNDRDMLRFKILANPTRTQQGKIAPICEDEKVVNWFIRKSKIHGFKILNLSIGKSCKHKCKEKNITFEAIELKGLLVVEDQKLFNETIAGGIGRSKSFGCGMLMVAHEKPTSNSSF